MTIEEQKAMLDEYIPKNEKISWKRKKKNIEKMILELEPIEEEIMALMAKKTKIIDKITTTRATMIAECVHPIESLVESTTGDGMICKFCEREIGFVGEMKNND